MKILYILGAYKPRASANGLCSDNIIQQLISEGHEVTALVNSSYGCNIESIDNDGLKIYRVKQRLYYRLIEWNEENADEHTVLSKLAEKAAYILNKIQLFVTSPSWPNISKLTNFRFKKKALSLQSKNDYDVVISAYNPINSLLAGYAVKKKYPNVMFIPYFLDSLSGGYGPRCFSEKTTVKRGLKIEKKIFAVADKIVLMKSSESHHRKYNSEFEEKIAFLDIPTLKKEHIDVIKSEQTKDTVKMLFIGSLSPSVRNPDALIWALDLIENAKVTVEFIGNISCIERFDKIKNKFGDRLIFTGFMNHDDLIEKITEADVLINIGNLVSTMVPSKIFEYMSYGKPIISTYDIENEPSKTYLERYPLALLLNGKDSAKINAGKIDCFVSDKVGKNVPFEEVEKLFYLNTPKAFTDCIIGNRR